MRVFKGSLAALIIVLATTAYAEQIGEIDGVLGDNSGAWQVHEVPGAGSTGTYSKLFPGQTSFLVQGHVDGSMGLEEALTVTFDLSDDGSVSDSNVIYLPTSDISTYYEASSDGLDVTIESLTETDAGLHIIGQVSGVLVFTKRVGVEFQVDPANPLPIDVSFDTKVIQDD